MLYNLRDIAFFSKYLIGVDNEKGTKKLKVDVSDISKDDKETLLMYDESFFDIKGYHMIIDYKDLQG